MFTLAPRGLQLGLIAVALLVSLLTTGNALAAARWLTTPTDTPQGIVVLVHGLNVKPSKMLNIAQLVQKMNWQVLLVTLQGHDEQATNEARIQALRTVSYPRWRKEVYQAYQVGRQRADQTARPLVLVGYSLGGLLGADILLSYPDVQWDRAILFAPALALHWRTQCLRLISMFDQLIIPSLSIPAYRSNEGTSIAAYNALFSAQRHFQDQADQRLNFPTLLIADRQDELVDVAKIMRWIDQYHWSYWQVMLVEKTEPLHAKHYAHLIIDESSVGQTSWAKIVMAIEQFLSQ